MWYTSGDGRIELQMTGADADSCSHSGSCDSDVLALSHTPYIARQLRKLAPETVREELRGYGAWDDEELADHAQNLQRLLWLAACDIAESPRC